MNRHTSRRRAGRKLLGLVCLAGATTFAASGLASAQVPPVDNHQTNATVGGSGGALTRIECGWALPDMVQTSTDATVPLFNYGAAGAAHDDNARVPAPTPCTSVVGTEARPTQTSVTGVPTVQNIQVDVTPNLDDRVGGVDHLRWIELWAAIDGAGELNPNAVVNWQVYHPDSSFKVQVEGTNYTPDDSLTQCSGPTGMFTAAVETNQIQTTAVSNLTQQHDSLQDYCLNSEKDLYYGAFALSKHQPWGFYRIVANVVNGNSVSTLTYYLYVQPVVGFAKDFTDVNFTDATSGPLSSGANINITGNTIWDPAALVSPNSINRPSVQSTGNTAITVEMAYTNMCLQLATTPATSDCGPAKEVTNFDGKLGSEPRTVESRAVANGPSPSSSSPATGPYMNFVGAATTAAGSQRFRTLCPNDVFKIDFSLHTPPSLLPGIYKGNVLLRVLGLGGTPATNAAQITPATPGEAPVPCPTDVGNVYNPALGLPAGFNLYLGTNAVTTETLFNGTTPKATGYPHP